MLGFVCFDDAKVLAAAKDVVTAGGLLWTPALQLGFETTLKDPQRRMAMELSMSSGTAQHVVTFALTSSPQTPIEYDVPAVKRRIADKLTQLGLKADLAIFDQMTTTNLPPSRFDALFPQMGQTSDPNVLAYFAQHLRVPSPAITADIPALLQHPEQQHALRTAITTAAIDPRQKPELEQFFRDLGAKGLAPFFLNQR